MVWVLLRSLLALLIIITVGFLYFGGYIVPKTFNYNDINNFEVRKKDVYIFENVAGPSEVSIVPQPISPQINQFSKGSDSRLAILLTDNTANWLELIQGLKSLGLPFIVTDDYKQALKHKVIFVYPYLSDTLPPKAIEQLNSFPTKGGVLIASAVINPKFFETFGFKSFANVPKKISQLKFNNSFPVTNNFTEPEEKNINIGDKADFSAAQYVYRNPVEPPLAIYENGDAAIVQKNYNNGHAYALGFDLGLLLDVGFNNRQALSENNTVAPFYANHYVPYLDVLLQLIKNIYLQGEPNGVYLSPVPYGKSLAVIATHDLCFTEAMKGTPYYLDVELKHGIKATYFLQTKYITDFEDYAFFTRENFPLFQKLIDNKMELGSHSVSHSLVFDHFPIGTGKEEYSSYQPYIMEVPGPDQETVRGKIPDSITIGGTILGELRVSRFLIQHFFPTNQVVSFRPGYLKYPPAEPQSLDATGYRFSSSTTANDSLTHLPFKSSYNRNYNVSQSAAVNIYQFPITVEDLSEPKLADRLSSSLELAKKIAHFGGMYMFLIHPNVDQSKIDFEDSFLSQVKNMASTWFGTLAEYGKWWAARDQIQLDVFEKANDTVSVKINAPQPISGLTLNIPENFKFQSSSPQLVPRQEANKFIIDQTISGTLDLEFKLENPPRQ